MKDIPSYVIFAISFNLTMIPIIATYIYFLKKKWTDLDCGHCTNQDASHVTITTKFSDLIWWGFSLRGCLQLKNRDITIATSEKHILTFSCDTTLIVQKWKNRVLRYLLPYLCIRDNNKQYLIIAKDSLFDNKAREKTKLLYERIVAAQKKVP